MGKNSVNNEQSNINMGKKKLLIYSAVVYGLLIIVYFFSEFSNSKNNIRNSVDAKLKSGSTAVNYIVPDVLHDLARNGMDISPNQDKNNTLLLSKYADEVGVEYIYSFIMIGDKVYYTSSSSRKEEIKSGDVYPYMVEYEEASDELKKLFNDEAGKEIIEETKDSYGYFRSYLKSNLTSNGRIYVTGSDIEIKDVRKIYVMAFLKTLLMALILLGAVVPILFSYRKIIKLEIDNNLNKRKLEKLEIDEVTGLPYIERLWNEEINIQYPSIFLIGINNLKVISSHYGDETGDKILKHISDILLAVETGDMCCKVYKVGLDEYAIVMDGEKSREDIYVMGEYLLENIYNHPFTDNEENIIITLIIGAASSDNKMAYNKNDVLLNLKRVFLEARMSLNYAFERRLRIFVFDDLEINDMSSASDEIFWTNKIATAITDKRIKPFFQPIYNIETGKIEKYESLIRLISRDGKVLTPYYFLNMAHKTGLYFKLTSTMIYKSFEFFSDKNMEFSVNISAKDILDETTKRIMLNNVKLFPKPELIVFEILESEGINNFSEIISFIKAVKEMGCKIAIDDFGSGYSNFERISQLEVDYVKIDGSLIKNIDTNQNNEILVQTIVDFSKKIGIKTIAEFVHSESVYKKVKELGIDYAQGYYIGEPSPNLVINHKLEASND